jgi:hypothetical protein
MKALKTLIPPIDPDKEVEEAPGDDEDKVQTTAELRELSEQSEKEKVKSYSTASSDSERKRSRAVQRKPKKISRGRKQEQMNGRSRPD